MSALINQARNRVPRFAEAAVERARLTVVPRRLQNAPRLPFVMLVSLLLILGVAGLLAFNTSMQQVSFKATALENHAARLAAKEQSLQMRLERLRDPQALAARARGMGLVPPASPAFIRLSDGKVLGTPAPALAADGIQVFPLPTVKPASLKRKPVIVYADDSKHAGENGAPQTRSGGSTRTNDPTSADTAGGRNGR